MGKLAGPQLYRGAVWVPPVDGTAPGGTFRSPSTEQETYSEVAFDLTYSEVALDLRVTENSGIWTEMGQKPEKGSQNGDEESQAGSLLGGPSTLYFLWRKGQNRNR